jgi:putative endonuclease
MILKIIFCAGSLRLERRISEHNNGEGANFTRNHLPVQLIYFEEFDRIDYAFYREKQVQGWSRKKKEALINGYQKKLPDLSRNYSQDGPTTGSLRQAPFDKLSERIS